MLPDKVFLPAMSFKKNNISKSVTFRTSGRLSYIQFDSLLTHSDLVHGVFSRNGGSSSPPYDSLNVSYNTGDKPLNVTENILLIKEEIGAARIQSMNQVHGTEIITFHRDTHNELSIRDADAMITDIPMLGIMVKQADCQGIIIYDAVRSVVAVVHCGWRGNVQDIPGSAVMKMKTEFGCESKDLIAAIGPSLGPCCAEFKSSGEIFPQEFMQYMVSDAHFNLWEISRMQLLRAGLLNEHIEITGICTKCNPDLFYSYRGEGETGRFGTVAMLKE
jgi:YfiH family protein